MSRTAIVVVHGVADQAPGVTVRSVIELLVESAPTGVKWEAVREEKVTVPVEPLAPRWAPKPRASATPTAAPGSLRRKLRASWRSDLLGLEPAAADRGIQVTNYLLEKNQINGARRESWTTTRIGTERSERGEVEAIDVYEMYWADLSRLSAGVLNIVTELFAFIFSLSQLGRDTVDKARARLAPRFSVAWALAGGGQSLLDWIFAHGLAVLMLHLALLGGLLIGIGLVASQPGQVIVLSCRIAGLFVAVVGTGWALYRPAKRRALPLGLIAAGAAVAWQPEPLAPYAVAAILLAVAAAVLFRVLKLASERFPFVDVAGRAVGVVVLALVVASAWNQLRHGASPTAGDLSTWTRSTMFAAEAVLWALKVLWICAAVVLAAWFVGSLSAARGASYEANASLATGRLCFGLALGVFLTLAMALWAVMNEVLGAAVGSASYAPCLFAYTPEGPPSNIAAPNVLAACVLGFDRANPSGTAVAAHAYLYSRYVASTAPFSLVAAVMAVLGGYLVATLLPSVLADLKLLANPDDRVDRWLTAGLRNLDVVVTGCFCASVVFGVFVAASYAGGALPSSWFDGMQRASDALLKPLVLVAAGLTAALRAFGKLLSKFVPNLRAPLDVALDVYNHFREFPRTGIPRARIFSRYAALLVHLRERDTDRIVVVAHSQGAVISAELLRFLASDGVALPLEGEGAKPSVAGMGLPPIMLVTFGCPLRQWYATRFPELYRWVLAARHGFAGPRAADIGAERWANAFCGGDYVGRWLWIPAGQDEDGLGSPPADSNQVSARTELSAGFPAAPSDAPAIAAATELEVCLGFGAHTHYFDRNQARSAWLIDHVVSTPAPPRSAPEAP